MREILFKAKRRNWKELPKEKWWVEGNLVLSNDSDKEFKAIIILKENSNMFLSKNECDLGFESWYLVDPETICQYTGFDGKNRKKIFEGDIICNYYDSEHLEDETLSAVLWNGYKWGIREEGSSDICDFELSDAENAEIVGNVFDNLELLEAVE